MNEVLHWPRSRKFDGERKCRRRETTSFSLGLRWNSGYALYVFLLKVKDDAHGPMGKLYGVLCLNLTLKGERLVEMGVGPSQRTSRARNSSVVTMNREIAQLVRKRRSTKAKSKKMKITNGLSGLKGHRLEVFKAVLCKVLGVKVVWCQSCWLPARTEPMPFWRTS